MSKGAVDMQQGYRRRGAKNARGYRRGREETAPRNYRRTAMQQGVVCALIFTAALFVRTDSVPGADYAKGCIRYVLGEHTDWRGLIRQARERVMAVAFPETRNADELAPIAKMTAPADGDVIYGFGPKADGSGSENFHYGLDYAGGVGDAVKCAADGVVREIGENEEYGGYISVAHGDTFSSFYGRCGEIFPAEGDSVKAGQVIAVIGDSETVEPHLHFEIREGESSFDPTPFLEN